MYVVILMLVIHITIYLHLLYTPHTIHTYRAVHTSSPTFMDLHFETESCKSALAKLDLHIPRYFQTHEGRYRERGGACKIAVSHCLNRGRKVVSDLIQKFFNIAIFTFTTKYSTPQ